MTHPSGLDPHAAAAIGSQFGVAFQQVRRDHLISLMLGALGPLNDRLVFSVVPPWPAAIYRRGG